MAFQPERIKKSHVLKALSEIDKGTYELRPSTKFDVTFEGKTYPPKEVMRLAHSYATGAHLWENSGGEPTNKYLRALGFKIGNKKDSLLDKSINVKEAFAKWLLENAPESYSYYLGNSNKSIIKRLDEINSYFLERDIFSVKKNNFKAIIEYLQFKNGKEERIKNKKFYDYDKKNSNGIPIAILGKKNYIKFLKEYGLEKDDFNINLKKTLQPYIKKYKELITGSEEYNEIYKWEAVQNFQKQWDLEADDLVKMIDVSFPGNVNLWTSNNYYPIAMLKDFAKLNPKSVRNALKSLLDENIEITKRINDYREATNKLLREYNISKNENNKHNYQDGRTISLLLSFNSPAKHSLFKHSVLKQFCEKIEKNPPKRGDVVKQVLLNNEINRQVKKVLVQDKDLLSLHAKRLSEDAYKADDNNILTQDFIYSTFAYNQNKRYWALGFNSNKARLQLFKEKGYWQALDYDKGSKVKAAIKAREKFKQIQVGDNVIIKGYGGSHDLIVHFKAKVIHVDSKNERLELEDLGGNLYKGKAPRDSGAGNWHETILEVKRQLDIDLLFYDTSMDKKQRSPIIRKYPLNQILYGPPGTGKTYNTVNLALEICGVKIENKERSVLKTLYDKKVEEGQIIFTTFHQSMSYEDFIEGIKPIEPEKDGEPVTYKVVEGIFKKACFEASFNFAIENETDQTDNVLDFSLAYDNFIQNIEERLASENQVELEIKNGGSVYVDSISAQGNIQIKHLNGLRAYTVSKTRLSKLQKSITDLDEITNINDTFRSIIGGSNSSAYWSVLNAILKESKFTNKTPKADRKYTWDDKKGVVQSLDRSIYKGKTGKAIVLIIDEINRGNVSSIFGELITLVEMDKRLGEKESLVAQLPYSKEDFGVPPNLYIIGTMNTADRSVEALDSALRRRFSFTEMPPVPDFIKEYGSSDGGTIDEIDLVKLLETINNRVEKLLDNDHAIGHSYFLKIKTLKDLKGIFANKVIPLLQEYFFGDYGKIGLVLGAGFVESTQGDNEDDFFASFEDYDIGSLLERKVYRIKNALEMNDEKFKDALLKLLG